MVKQIATDQGTPHPLENGMLVITQQELSPALKNYVAMLVDRHPFAKDFILDSRRVITELTESWPVCPAWSVQAEQLWKHIDDIVHTIPAITATHGFFLRVAVAHSLAPVSLPQPHESAAIATFDAVEGVLRRCVLSTMDEPPPLDALSVASGVTIICQPTGHLPDPFVDDPMRLSNDSTDLYGERNQDQLVTGNRFEKASATSGTSLQQQQVEQQRRNYEVQARRLREETRLQQEAKTPNKGFKRLVEFAILYKLLKKNEAKAKHELTDRHQQEQKEQKIENQQDLKTKYDALKTSEEIQQRQQDEANSKVLAAEAFQESKNLKLHHHIYNAVRSRFKKTPPEKPTLPHQNLSEGHEKNPPKLDFES